MIKTSIILLLISLVFSLKVSEVGVNDWHIQGVGQIRHAQIGRNKLFVWNHKQGIIGLLNKLDGSFESRITIGQGQKVVFHSQKQITIATRNNQLITYSLPTLTATTSNKYIHNNFTNNRIQAIQHHNTHEYLLLAKSLLIDGKQHEQIKADKQKGERFTKLFEFNDKIHIVMTNKEGQWCIIDVQKGIANRKCWNNLGQEINQIHVFKQNAVLSFDKNTLLIDENLNEIKRFSQGLIDFVQSTLVFESQSFNLETSLTEVLRPIPSTTQLSSSLPIYLSQSAQSFKFLKQTHPLPAIPKSNGVHILRAWLNYKTEYEYEVLVQFSDLRTVMYEIGREVKAKWEKEESLSYVNGVIFMKYRVQDGLDNEYHRRLIGGSYRHLPLWERISRIPQFLSLRINEEIADFSFFIGYALSHLGAFVSSAIGGQVSFSKFKMSPDQELHYGLRQQIITWTAKNTLFGIDSKNHQIKWKKHIGDKQIVGMLKLKRDYETDAAIIVTYNGKDAIILQISQEGVITELYSLKADTTPTIYELNDYSLLLKVGKQVHRYELVKSQNQDFKSYYFYSIQGKEVTGWKTQNSQTVPVWNFYIPQNHKLAGSASSFRGQHMARIPLYENDKVFFKNVDFTNLALLTTQGSTLHLFILNGMTGQVQFNEYKTSIDTKQPINLAYDQNNVLVTYYNSRNKCFQVWTVQGYLSRIEASAIGMIKDYVQGKEYKPQQNRQNIIFVSAVYGSIVPIKHMFISQSKQSLIRRNMLVITRDNKLYSIGRELISTRRPKKDGPPGFFSNEKYPQYTYFLPYQPIAFFSYDLPLSTLNSIHVAPTDMESSIFLFAHGIDCFMMRVAPDRTFDTMTQDFNQNILLLILVVVTIGILWMRNLVKKAKLKKPHLQ